MATQFDFLAQARPASLYKLLEKLSIGDAAIVMTGLPQNLVIQTLAFFPDDQQGVMVPAMRDARKVSDKLREQTAQKIRTMLTTAKQARAQKAPETHAPAELSDNPPAKPATRRPVPSAPMGPASAAMIQPGAQDGAAGTRQAAAAPVAQEASEKAAHFSELEPSASILTGSVPDEFPDLPQEKKIISITPKFTPPAVSAKKRKADPEAPAPSENNPLPGEGAAPQARPRQAAAGATMNRKGGANPYTPTPAAHDAKPAASRPAGKARDTRIKGATGAGDVHEVQATPNGNAASEEKDGRSPNSGELIGQAIADLGQKIKRAFTPPEARGKETETSGDGFKTRDPASSRSTVPSARKKAPPPQTGSGKPVPWVPRTATTSPINGPAIPGTPPPVAGDPFRSPLAKAGLLDLIGRAQEKFLPKGTVRPASAPKRTDESERIIRQARPRVKPGRPEPREGVLSSDKVGFNATPRVIGPRPKAEELVGDDRVPAPGARRMDGKAILAAILRSATPDVRRVVAHDDPKLFDDLRGRMFYFDDLIYTEDNALARVFTAAPAETAALALKFAAPALKKRVLAAVSPGRAKALCDTPPRAGMDDVEAAQKQILGVALKLQAAGRILIDPRDPDLAGQ